MKSIKKVDFKCIDVNLEFNGQLITIKVEPFRTINYIKEKAINKILDLPSNIHFYYLGKDLTKFGSDKIGNFFNNREKVTIKLKSPQNSYSQNSHSPKNIFNNRNNYYHKSNLITYKGIKDEEMKYINLGTKNKSQKELKIIKSLGDKTKSFNNDEISKDNLNNNKSEKSLPSINNVISKIRGKNKLFLKNVKNKEDIDSKEIEKLCNCERHNISLFCRNCKKFICFECKAEQKHKNHLSLKLNMLNIEKNVKIYGKLIQDDIQKKIEMNRNVFSYNEIFDNNKLISRKQKIINKYQEAIKIYQRIMAGIDNKLKTEDKERTNLIINAYKDLSQKMNNQLFALLNKLNKNYIQCNKKVMFTDLRSYFDEINSKEETLSFLGKDIIKYHLKNEINTKLKSSLDKIDRIIDEISDDNNPFNLDNKYYEEMLKMEIIKQEKDNKGKDLNNNSALTNPNKSKNDESNTRSGLEKNFSNKNQIKENSN